MPHLANLGQMLQKEFAVKFFPEGLVLSCTIDSSSVTLLSMVVLSWDCPNPLKLYM